MAGGVLLKIVYLPLRCLLSMAVLALGGDQDRDAELLVLRHENAVRRRRAGGVRYEPADRTWLAALARLIPRSRWAEVFSVTPATLVAWHRKLTANTTPRAGAADRDDHRRSAASLVSPCGLRGTTRCGDIAGSTAS